MEELKPCPFCGSEVDMDDFGGKNRDGTQGGLMIDCCNPDCFLVQYSRGGPKPYGSHAEIVKAWNTRASQWRPIDNGASCFDGSPVALWHEIDGYLASFIWDGVVWFRPSDSAVYDGDGITHWMPLPQPPEVQG